MQHTKEPTKNEIFTKVVNDPKSMIAMNSSYAAIFFASIANAPLFFTAGIALAVGNTTQAYKRARSDLS